MFLLPVFGEVLIFAASKGHKKNVSQFLHEPCKDENVL